MSLQIMKEISLDFYDIKVVTVEAKQFDKSSRYISVTCTNQGNPFPLDSVNYSAFVRYKKADEFAVFNRCSITDGKILVELTEQMLAAAGMCVADLLIIDNQVLATNQSIPIITSDGDILEVSGNGVVSTMKFCVNVISTPFDNSDIESASEFNALNDLIEKVTKDYTYVITEARKYAEAASASEGKAKTSENNAKKSEQTASEKATAASNSATAAKNSETAAKDSETKAKASQTASAASQQAAANSATAAAGSASESAESAKAAKTSETNAKNSETEAKKSQTAAATSEKNAENYSNLSKSYAVGTGGVTRNGDDTDNSKYYYELALELVKSLNGAVIPKGTITFQELFALGSLGKVAGYMYNVSNDFTTDATFVEGAGHKYTGGTNVYYTPDGKWDVFAGTMDSLLQVIADLQKKVDTLEEDVSMLESMIMKGEAIFGICTNDGIPIVTDTGAIISSCFKINITK